MNLSKAWRNVVDITKATAASITDALAVVGERMPGLQQITLSVPGASVTVAPAPTPTQSTTTCPHCGK